MRGVRKRLVLLGLGILLSAWLNFSFFTLTNHLPPKNVPVAEAQPSKPLSREERPRPSSHLRLSPSPFSHRLPPTPRRPPTTNEPPPVAGASAARRTVQSSPEELDPSDLLAELAPLLNEQDDFPSAVDPKSSDVIEMMELVNQRSIKGEKVIAVSLVSQGMLDFTYNWVCSVRRFNFSNYVILAGDVNTYTSLKAANEPVVFMAGRAFGANQFLRYGTTAYQGLMHLRLLYIKHLLQLGYRVLLFDVDQVWLANPFDFIDIHSPADIHTQHDGLVGPPVSCMGFIFLNPTPALLKLWEVVRVEHSLRTRTRPYAERNTEQKLFNANSRLLERHYLNRELFINGGLYWHQAVSVNHFQPVQIHANWVVGKENKFKRLESKQLWMLTPGYHWNTTTPAVCDYTFAQPLTNIAVAPPRLHEMVITIKILPSASPSSVALAETEKGLTALIKSLLAADYSTSRKSDARWREKRIDIELHRPPATEAAEKDIDALYSDIFQKLQAGWSMGEVRAVNTPVGVSPLSLELRLAAWTADSDREAAIMIDDQQVVAREWWRWVRYAVGAHYCHLDSFDARLFGVVLERNINIIAYSQISTASAARTGAPFYFQNVGYHATLFFPRLWRRFISWVREWKAGQPQNPYPELAALNYARIHHYASQSAARNEDLRNRWYVWWLAYTAELGIVALHPPAEVVLVQSQLAPVSKSNSKSKPKPRADLTTDLSFLDTRRSPLSPIGQLYKYRTTDLRGISWHSPLHLEGILNHTTTLFNSPADNRFVSL